MALSFLWALPLNQLTFSSVAHVKLAFERHAVRFRQRSGHIVTSISCLVIGQAARLEIQGIVGSRLRFDVSALAWIVHMMVACVGVPPAASILQGSFSNRNDNCIRKIVTLAVSKFCCTPRSGHNRSAMKCPDAAATNKTNMKNFIFLEFQVSRFNFKVKLRLNCIHIYSHTNRIRLIDNYSLL